MNNLAQFNDAALTTEEQNNTTGGRRRRKRGYEDNNPFDGNGSYTPRVNNPYRETNRIIAKAKRIGRRNSRRYGNH